MVCITKILFCLEMFGNLKFLVTKKDFPFRMDLHGIIEDSDFFIG